MSNSVQWQLLQHAFSEMHIACAAFGVDPLSYEAIAPNQRVLRLHKKTADLQVAPTDVVQLVKISVPIVSDDEVLSAPPRRRITGKSSGAAGSDPYMLRRGTPIPTPTQSEPSENYTEDDLE